MSKLVDERQTALGSSPTPHIPGMIPDLADLSKQIEDYAFSIAADVPVPYVISILSVALELGRLEESIRNLQVKSPINRSRVM